MTIFSNMFILIVVFVTFTPTILKARDLKISVAQLPVISENKDKGVLVEYVKAMQKAYKKGKITYEVVPFNRSIHMVTSGQADIHVPILKIPGKTDAELGYSHSSENIWNVVFALYTHKDRKDITPETAKNFDVETDAAHVPFFNFAIKSSTCASCSLKRVNNGKTDGFIYASQQCDAIIAGENLKNLKSTKYQTFEGKFVLPMGEKRKEIDKILTDIVKETKANGDYDRTIGKIDSYYRNWKPSS